MKKPLQQEATHAGSRTTFVFVFILAALICVNLMYFISTHTHLMDRAHASRLDELECNKLRYKHLLPMGSSTAAANALNTSAFDDSAVAAVSPSPSPSPSPSLQFTDTDAEASVKYLQQVVFADKPHIPRKPLDNYWLEKTKAEEKDKSFKEYRDKVAAYLNSTEFKQRWHALKSQATHERGIVIATGGRYYLPQSIVLLRILRHYHRSTLPVELFWHGEEEMENGTLAALQKEFGPLEGYDVKKLPYPKHHRPNVTIKGFPMKPYALYHSKFKEVFLLDCDVVLRRDPAYMFDAPLFKQYGNYFWGDIYGAGMVRDEVFEYVGLNKSVKDKLNEGKAEFNRYAESGQVMINRAMHLDMIEWMWFLNSFNKGYVYEFMYGDKDTYGVAFGLAGKAHYYQHMNVPPGGVFTNLGQLGWSPREGQMRKQGNWWLQGLVHYDHKGEVLLIHRVTGEVNVFSGHAPRDEIITPPIPHSWSMWHMGYGPEKTLLRAIDVVNYNVTYFIHTATPNQVCPVAAWSAYWTLRTHGIPTVRNTTLEKRCDAMLEVEYGKPAADMIRKSTLLEHPLRLVVNGEWDKQVDGGWNAPKNPLWGVPLNQTEAWNMWLNMDNSVKWAKAFVHDLHSKILHDRRRRLFSLAASFSMWR